jgi:hypothetical protein
MTTPSLIKRIEALEAGSPEQALRVVTRHEDLDLSPEERARHAAEFSAGLPRHRGLTVVVRRFGRAPTAGETEDGNGQALGRCAMDATQALARSMLSPHKPAARVGP